MRKLLIPLLLTLIAFVLIAGISCSKKSTTPAEETPIVPPSGMLKMDFSLFTQSTLYKPATVRCADFDTASVIIIIWATITEAVLVLPQAAFGLAISQPPTRVDAITWRWTFGNVDGNNISLIARLVASDSVFWEMRVTNSTLTNFLWYNGKCNRAATGGWWRFNKPDSATHTEIPVLWLGWRRNPADTTGNLTLANISPGDPNYGDTLTYQVNGTVTTVRIRDISGSRPGVWVIMWDRLAHYGSILYPEGVRKCWGSDLQCIDCDSIPFLAW